MSVVRSSGLPSKTALRWEGARALSRRWILDAAGTVFAEEGFENATMKRIAEACDVSKVTIYAHYRDKAQLYGAVMDSHLASLPVAGLHMHGTLDLGDALMQINDGIGRLAANPSCQAFCRTLSRSDHARAVYMEHWRAVLQPYFDLAEQAMATASAGSLHSSDSEKFLRLILAEHGLPNGATPMSGSHATVALFVRAYAQRPSDAWQAPPERG